MAFRLTASDRTIGVAIRRIAVEQVDKALTALDSAEQAEAIHEVRVRCKKIRGLIRLVRPAFPAFPDTNAFFRDIAASLSDLRDAKVMQDTLDTLAAHYANRVEREEFVLVRQAFTSSHEELSAGSALADRLTHCRTHLLAGREQVLGWELEADGFEAISGGFAKTYRRARKAADKAFAGGAPEDHHELRKRVKYHWMHARLLHPLAPKEMRERAHLAKKLGTLLGEHHDLAVLAERLATLGVHEADPQRVALMSKLTSERSKGLSQEAEKMASRLLAEKTGRLVDRVEALWKPWAKKAGYP